MSAGLCHAVSLQFAFTLIFHHHSWNIYTPLVYFIAPPQVAQVIIGENVLAADLG